MELIVVGGGMQGRVIAENLRGRKEGPHVVIADINEPARLPRGVEFKRVDILDGRQAKALVAEADAVVLAVPSSIAHASLTNLIDAGKPIADVSFTPEPPLSLHSQAVKKGACCIVDCGIAPGLSNVLIGSAFLEMGGLDFVKVMIGGIPQEPPAVFRHAIYFNPHDLIANYIRPAKVRRGGENLAAVPLDVPIENYEDVELGRLEAFLSGGLRSLITSYPKITDMVELTLRWPGHIDMMKNLQSLGLLQDEHAANGIAGALSLRFPAEEYPDVLILTVEVTKGADKRTWRLMDRRTEDASAVSRATGFTTAAIAMLLARKQFTEPGVHPPERLGEANLAQDVLRDLEEHGVNLVSRQGGVESLNAV